jgi:hypothetical protein
LKYQSTSLTFLLCDLNFKNYAALGCHPAPQSGKPQTNKIVCAGQEAGLTIPRRMPSGPTAQIVAAREEMNI